MAKATIFLVFGLVATVFADPLGDTPLSSPVSDEQAEAFKEELEEETKDGNVTCENYHESCAKASGDDPNSVCRIMLQGYLCENLRDLAGIREIIARISKLHPDTINLEAGHEFDHGDVAEEEEEDEEFFQDPFDYEDSGEYVEQ